MGIYPEILNTIWVVSQPSHLFFYVTAYNPTLSPQFSHPLLPHLTIVAVGIVRVNCAEADSKLSILKEIVNTYAFSCHFSVHYCARERRL